MCVCVCVLCCFVCFPLCALSRLELGAVGRKHQSGLEGREREPRGEARRQRKREERVRYIEDYQG